MAMINGDSLRADAMTFHEGARGWRLLSLGLFGVLSLFLLAFGLLYANVHQMLWFHAAAVPEGIRDEVKPLYFALMKLIGGSCIALALLGFYVTFGPLRRGTPGAAVAVTLAYAILFLAAAYVAETLARLTGAPTSWHIMGVLLAIDAAAFVAHVLVRRARA